MKCFYHSADLDGHCSGAIVKYFNPECELIGINHGDKFQWDKINDNEIIYMVDFSLQPFTEMIKLSKKCKLIWIDHHISAIKESVKFNIEGFINGLRIDGVGACLLTWVFCSSFSNKKQSDGNNLKTPSSVRLLSEYDVWNHTNPNTLPFQFGMRMENTNPLNISFWNNIFNNDIKEIIKKGKIILQYEKQQNKLYISNCSFETKLDGFKCIAINKMLTNSKMFDSIWDNKKYDIMLTFGFRKNKWTVSLYTDKKDIDVSIIAKKYNGGGHKQAGGFQCENLNFLKIN